MTKRRSSNHTPFRLWEIGVLMVVKARKLELYAIFPLELGEIVALIRDLVDDVQQKLIRSTFFVIGLLHQSLAESQADVKVDVERAQFGALEGLLVDLAGVADWEALGTHEFLKHSIDGCVAESRVLVVNG